MIERLVAYLVVCIPFFFIVLVMAFCVRIEIQILVCRANKLRWNRLERKSRWMSRLVILTQWFIVPVVLILIGLCAVAVAGSQNRWWIVSALPIGGIAGYLYGEFRKDFP